MSHDYDATLGAQDVVDAIAGQVDRIPDEYQGEYRAGMEAAYEDAADIAHQALASEAQLYTERDEARAQLQATRADLARFRTELSDAITSIEKARTLLTEGAL